MISPPRTAPERLPLNTLAIAFGLTGLAGVWSLAATNLEVPALVAEVFWVVAATSWGWLIVVHTVRGHQSSARLIDQLRHPVQGPIAALVPVVAMLMGVHVYTYLPEVGFWVVVIALVAALVFAGWILGRWISGGIEPDAIHGGYFLPTVAAGFIGATTAAKVGLQDLAIGAFAVGIFFWLVIFTMLLSRLALRPALPAPLVPTLAIIAAPPAVGGTAWMTITGGGIDSVDYAFAALTVLMVLVQFAFVRSYSALRFSLGFWSFTFPFAAVSGYAIEWLALERPEGWRITAWVLVLVTTAFVLTIATRSLSKPRWALCPYAGSLEPRTNSPSPTILRWHLASDDRPREAHQQSRSAAASNAKRWTPAWSAKFFSLSDYLSHFARNVEQLQAPPRNPPHLVIPTGRQPLAHASTSPSLEQPCRGDHPQRTDLNHAWRRLPYLPIRSDLSSHHASSLPLGIPTAVLLS